MTQNKGSSGNTVSFSSRPYFISAHFLALQTKANTTFKTFSPPFSPLQTPAASWSEFVLTLKHNCFPRPFQKVQTLWECRSSDPVHVKHSPQLYTQYN